jgi:hypothetical protein
MGSEHELAHSAGENTCHTPSCKNLKTVPLRKKKTKQHDINHTQEGIGHLPAGQVQGEQRVGKWREESECHGTLHDGHRIHKKATCHSRRPK